jgi:hypothetical protein
MTKRLRLGRWLDRRSSFRVGAGMVLVVGGIVLARDAERAPGWVLGGLATAVWPLVVAWRAARGTALRAAVVWGALAIVWGMVAQGRGLGESLAGGRPGAGHWAYLSALATLAALISVFNARRPGGGAWALLMALLVLVFLIPWLEGAGLASGGGAWERLHLESPWSWFFGILTLAGVINYVPTRYLPAAGWLALGLGWMWLALVTPSCPMAWRGTAWSASPWALAVASWTAEICSRRAATGRNRLERLWFPFRDHWGTVWGLRIQERLNRSAEAAGWPIRLSWHGVVPAPGRSGQDELPEAAAATFKGLLRRFADEERIGSWEGAISPR